MNIISRRQSWACFLLVLCMAAAKATAACTPSVTASLADGKLKIRSTVASGCGSVTFYDLKIDGQAQGSGLTCFNLQPGDTCQWDVELSGYCWKTGTHLVEVTATCNHVETNPDGSQFCKQDPSATASTTFNANSTPSASVSYSGPDAQGNGTVTVPYQFPGTGRSFDRLLTFYIDGVEVNSSGQIDGHLDEQGVWTFPQSVACFPSGSHEIKVVAIACRKGDDPAYVHEAISSFYVNSKPEVSVQVDHTTNVAQIDYDYPNTNHSEQRDLEIYIDGNRVEWLTFLLIQTGSRPPYQLPLCWKTLRVVATSCNKHGNSDYVDEAEAENVERKPVVNLELLPLGGSFLVSGSYDLKATNGSFDVDLRYWVGADGVEQPGHNLYHVPPPVPPQGSFSFLYTPPSGSRQLLITATGANACATTTTDRSIGNSCPTKDPVHLEDGNVQVTDVDLLPPVAGQKLLRTYDSHEQTLGLFGRGWTTLFNQRMILNADGTQQIVSLVTRTNDVVTFRGSGGVYRQTWPSARQSDDVLKYDAASGTYSHRAAGSTEVSVYRATDGHLIAIRDIATGREAQIAYDAQGLPQSLTDSWTGTSWLVTMDAPHRRVSSMTVSGRPDLVWTYTYDGDGNLTSVLAPGSATWRTYEYVNGRMTASYDGAAHLIEAHTYDSEGYGISSTGPGDEIASIEYNLPGSSPAERLTRVMYKAGATSDYVLRPSGGSYRPVRITGGCAACGSADATYAHDAEGRTVRTQNADGYVSVRTYDASGLSSLHTSMKPQGCDPATDPARCRLSADALAAAVLEATPASILTTYTRGDASWPDKVTAAEMPSVLSPTAVRREEYLYRPGTGTISHTTIRGLAGDPAVEQIRTMVTLRYGDLGMCGSIPCTPSEAYAPAFAPGGTFSSAWLSLPQPPLVKSIDEPRTDVEDVTSFVYYPVDASVPGLLRGHLAATRNALGHIVRYESYDAFGNASRVVDPNGVANELTVDLLGRAAASTLKAVSGCDTASDPLCATDLVSTSTYSPAAGPLQSTQRPSGGPTVYTYDARGRVQTISRGPSLSDLRERIETSYDPLTGKKSLERTLALDGGTWVEKQRESFAYDTHARLLTTTHADGSAVHYTYDASDRVATIRDENHTAPNTRYHYDEAGRVKQVEQTLSTAAGGKITTSYAYNRRGNLVSVTDPNGNLTSYVYDDFGQMQSQQSPVSGTTDYVYDEAGNLGQSADANGATTTRTYDAANRVVTAVSARDGATESVSWTYDADTAGVYGIGRLTLMEDPTGSTTYAYDRRGLLQQETHTIDGAPYLQTYGYDANGNRTQVGYPSGRVVSYAFDASDRPVGAQGTIGGQTTQYVTAAAYLPFGPPTSLTLANGTLESRTYDARYLPATSSLTAGVTTLAQYTYSHDPAGNITGIADGVDGTYSRTFGYDDLNRLVTANSGTSLWGTGNYAYDAMGNMLTATFGSRVRSFAYAGTTPRIDTASDGGWNTEMQYDSAGNELNGPVAGNNVLGDSRAYSPRNLLQAIEVTTKYCLGPQGPEGCTHWLTRSSAYWNGYDGRGVRVASTRSQSYPVAFPETEYFFYTPELTSLATFSSTWEAETDVIWFGGRPVASQSTLDEDPRFTFTDHLGTPIVQTDAAATVIWQPEYDPFGNIVSIRAGIPNEQPLRFPGQQVAFTNGAGEEENYNIFRWYRSGWGRYTQSDPTGLAAGLNLYAYALSNPNSLVDPLGAQPKFPQFPTSTTDDCSADEWKYCEGKCGSRPVIGCYVTITHKLKTVKGFPQFGIQRTVNCNCKEDDCDKSWPDKLKNWWKGFANPNNPPLPPFIPIPPNLPTPRPVIPGLPPFFINPCMLNPRLCNDGTGIA